jgi:hypothetical protein
LRILSFFAAPLRGKSSFDLSVGNAGDEGFETRALLSHMYQ